jgi:hypothetical protein
MENDMSDIATELRERSLRAEQEGEPLALLDEAADEIDRLRLTGMERAAIGWAIMECESMPTTRSREAADTLRALLKRLG